MRLAFDVNALLELDLQYYLIMVACSYHQINITDSISYDRERSKNELNPQIPNPGMEKERLTMLVVLLSQPYKGQWIMGSFSLLLEMLWSF